MKHGSHIWANSTSTGEPMAKKILKKDINFVGIDDWSRFVYKHEPSGYYFCTVDRLQNPGDTVETANQILEESESLYIKTPYRDFEGEPSHPVKMYTEEPTNDL